MPTRRGPTPHRICAHNYTIQNSELEMGKRRRWRAIRIVTVMVGGLLILGACLLRNNLSLLLISLGIITLSVIDYIDGSIWWLSDEWTDDPDSPIAKIVAIAWLLFGGLLFIIWLAI